MLTPEADQPTPSHSSAVPVPASTSPFPRANGELILIADDQDSVRELLETILNDHGYRTVTAVDTADAVAVLTVRRDEITAIVSDMHMPNTGDHTVGDVLRRVRANVPILFMSGLGSDEDGEEMRPANSSDPFLLKPFRPVALLQAVHRLLHPDRPSKT
jgi:CheY-like chemotaxis protein